MQMLLSFYSIWYRKAILFALFIIFRCASFNRSITFINVNDSKAGLRTISWFRSIIARCVFLRFSSNTESKDFRISKYRSILRQMNSQFIQEIQENFKFNTLSMISIFILNKFNFSSKLQSQRNGFCTSLLLSSIFYNYKIQNRRRK